jgi:hypothetical protein
MKKIRSMADIERGRRRNNIILGVVMIFLLLGSTAGYSLMSRDSEGDSSVSDSGFDFVKDGGLWKVNSGGGIFGFRYLPSEVSDVEVNASFNLGDYSEEVLYFVNPDEGVGEVLNNVGDYILRYQESCIEGGECEGDLPVKDCTNNLIIFERGNVTSVYQNESCIYIIGDGIRGTDAFLYNALGII